MLTNRGSPCHKLGGLPAVDTHGPPLLRVVVQHPLPEAKKVGCIERYAMIRPHQEMELPHFTHWHLDTTLPSKLENSVTPCYMN